MTISRSLLSRISGLSLALLVLLFACTMCSAVVGVIFWKSLQDREAVLRRSEVETRNLAHSLANHASNAIQAADVATAGVAELLRFQAPVPERMNSFLAGRVQALPQLREIGVLGKDGAWRYSSLNELPAYSNADRDYFVFHRDSPDLELRVNDVITSRLTGRQTVLLSRRISNYKDGSFDGVVVAAIDVAYFSNFYASFDLGAHGSIGLLTSEGKLLARWPNDPQRSAAPNAFIRELVAGDSGFSVLTSPFDGLRKYFAYERLSRYPVMVGVAVAEADVLAAWNRRLQVDAIIAGVLLAVMLLLTMVLLLQVNARRKAVRQMSDRERRYRLLADNVADIVLLLDRRGRFIFASPSIRSMVDSAPDALVGRSCLELVHPDDLAGVVEARASLTDDAGSRTAEFRVLRSDGVPVWMEAHFKLAHGGTHSDGETTCVLRDIGERRRMEQELRQLNDRLGELATTDGLTGLANRRTFDLFIEDKIGGDALTSLLMIDIDNFKNFNDALGHQAGDDCLRKVGAVIAEATRHTRGLSARFGGEEFAVVLPGIGEADAARVASAIRLGVRALDIRHPSSERDFVSISIGVAELQSREQSAGALIRDADRALYECKRLGRHCVVRASTLAAAPAAQLQSPRASSSPTARC